MKRSIISIVFSTTFLLFISAPTIILIIDNNADLSSFYISSEEEEKGHEKSQDKELMFYNLQNTISDLDSNEIENNLEYLSKNYSKPHLNIIFPPPDFYMLF